MIRETTNQDLETLYLLYKLHQLSRDKLSGKDYASHIQQKGFVFGLDTKKDFEKELKNADFSLISEAGDGANGYVIVNQEKYFPENAENIIWTKPELKQIYFHESLARTLYQIVVHPEFARNRIGSQLISKTEQLLQKKKQKHLFSIIMVYPLVNAASVAFHGKSGFQVACVTYPKDMKFKNYMSVLMYKEL